VTEKYPERLEERTRIKQDRDQDVINVLQVFAPYLLETVRLVPDHVIREIELKSQLAHQPMGLGNEIGEDAPPGIKVSEVPAKVTITFRDLELFGDIDLNGDVTNEASATPEPRTEGQPAAPASAGRAA
jgi:hypothetical protein